MLESNVLTVGLIQAYEFRHTVNLIQYIPKTLMLESNVPTVFRFGIRPPRRGLP